MMTDCDKDQLQALVDAGEFPAGSMKPKVEAILEFINVNEGKSVEACITSLEKAADALLGKAGS